MLDISFLTYLFYALFGFFTFLFLRILLLNSSYRKEQRSQKNTEDKRIWEPDNKTKKKFRLTVGLLAVTGIVLFISLLRLSYNYTPLNEKESLYGLSLILSAFPILLIHHVFVVYNIVKFETYYFQGLRLRLTGVTLNGSEKKKVFRIYASFVVITLLFTIVGLVLLAALRHQYY